MSLVFDTEKKEEKDLVLEKRVPLRVMGKDFVYFMTNDYTVMTEKVKSLGCTVPQAEDFLINHSLANNVKMRMKSLKVCWSVVVTTLFKVVNYYDESTDQAYFAKLEGEQDDEKISSISLFFYHVVKNNVIKLSDYISAEFDVDTNVQNGLTPLMAACEKNSCDSIKWLLEHGADVNALDANDRTPLMYTSFNDSIGAAKILLVDKKVNIEERNSYDGTTALYSAVAYGSHKVLKELLKAGADPDASSYSGETPLLRAIIKKDDEAALLLMKAGADVNRADKTGRTPLMAAANYNNAVIAEKLLKAGAIFNVKEMHGAGPFLIAAGNNSKDVIDLFLKTQEIYDEEYTNAVVLSASYNYIDTTALLIEKSRAPDQMAFAGLVSASKKDKSEVIHICMDYGCNVDDTLHFGMTPLMLASYENSKNAAAQLIAYGADINKTDDDGMTALMYAASKNNLEIMTLLIRNGADKKICDKSGKTFYDHASTLDTRSYQQLIYDRMKAKLPKNELNRKSEIPEEHQNFNERFNYYMQKYFERYPANKNSNIYNAAGISKQSFSKILSSRRDDFRPKKETVIQLAIGLKLTLDETEDLMQSSGYTFSTRERKDLEMKKLLSEENYNIHEWNSRIYEITGKALLKTDSYDEE